MSCSLCRVDKADEFGLIFMGISTWDRRLVIVTPLMFLIFFLVLFIPMKRPYAAFLSHRRFYTRPRVRAVRSQEVKPNGTIREHNDGPVSTLALLYNASPFVLSHIHIRNSTDHPTHTNQPAFKGCLERTKPQSTQKDWAGRCSKYVGSASERKWMLWGRKKNKRIIRRGGKEGGVLLFWDGMVMGEDVGGL